MLSIERLKQINNDLEFDQILMLYRSAGWISAEESQTENLIRRIVSKSYLFAVARLDGQIIGMGRVISDSVSDAYIQDVTVHPVFRKQGIGGQIISFLINTLHKHQISWIGLISEPGYEGFYQKLGFSPMINYTPFLYVKKF